jgi:hypothetical protein
MPLRIALGASLILVLVTAVSSAQTQGNTARTSRDENLVARGKYVVEGLAACGQCHTPRNSVKPVGNCGTDGTCSWGVADDGSVYGLAYRSCSNFRTFRWNPRRGTHLFRAATKADGTPSARGPINDTGSVGVVRSERSETPMIEAVTGLRSTVVNCTSARRRGGRVAECGGLLILRGHARKPFRRLHLPF